MNCGREDCTGIHNTHRPGNKLCPGARERKQEQQVLKRERLRSLGLTVLGTPPKNADGALPKGQARREHGTHAGYAQHLRRREDPCAVCLIGHDIYVLRRRTRHQQRRISEYQS